MYRTLNDVIKETNVTPFIVSDSNKTYKYTNSSFGLDEDYIFIPMEDSETDCLKKIEFHLKNKNCKGFFIRDIYIEKPEYIRILHDYMPENVLVARNTYNAGYETARVIARSLQPEIILLMGTDENEEIKNTLSLSLNLKKLPYESYWERAIDPILRMDEEQKYVIIENNLKKPRTSKYFTTIKEGMILVYSKISMTRISTYGSVGNYMDEWTKIAKNNKPKIVFYKESNDLLRLNGVNNTKLIEGDYAQEVLNYLNVPLCEYKKEWKKVEINNTGSLYSIKKSIREFILNNKDKEKVIIMSRIHGLSDLCDAVHSDIMNEITEDIDHIITISLASYIPNIRKHNKKTNITLINGLNESNISEIKHILKFKNTEAYYLIISEDKELWNLI